MNRTAFALIVMGLMAVSAMSYAASVIVQWSVTSNSGGNGGSLTGMLVGLETGGCGPPAPATPPPGGDCGGWAESPPIHEQINRMPDFQGGGTSFAGAVVCKGNVPYDPVNGWQICQGTGGWIGMLPGGSYGMPLQTNTAPIAGDSYDMGDGAHTWGCPLTNPNGWDYYSNWAAIAADDPNWHQAMVNSITQGFAWYASQQYYIRVGWEWGGSWYCWSPWLYGCTGIDPTQGSSANNPCIPVATWAQGMINTINIIRGLMPGVKIAVDGADGETFGCPPFTVSCVNPGGYKTYSDALIGHVDIWTLDTYFPGGSAGNPGGLTGADAWAGYMKGGDKAMLPSLAARGVATGKPIAIPEFCDPWNDGYVTQHMAQYAVANNMVSLGVWDQNGPNDQPPYGCYWNPNGGAQYSNPASMNAFKNAFGGITYSGSYFTKKPLPPAAIASVGW